MLLRQHPSGFYLEVGSLRSSLFIRQRGAGRARNSLVIGRQFREEGGPRARWPGGRASHCFFHGASPCSLAFMHGPEKQTGTFLAQKKNDVRVLAQKKNGVLLAEDLALQDTSWETRFQKPQRRKLSKLRRNRTPRPAKPWPSPQTKPHNSPGNATFFS